MNPPTHERFRRLDLLLLLVRRDLANRYAGSVAGALWLLLQPLMMLGVYALVFGLIFRVTPETQPGMPAVPYVGFIAVALWPWLAFSEAVLRGTTAVQQQAALVKKVAFRSELLVVATVIASFAVHATGSVLVLVVLAAFGIPVDPAGLPTYVLGFASLLIPALGLALGLSAIQVFVRDAEQVVTQLVTVVFYATPILYASAMVPEALRPVVDANPVGQVINLMRSSMLPLQYSADAWSLVICAGVFALMLAGGAWIFARLSPHFEDTL